MAKRLPFPEDEIKKLYAEGQSITAIAAMFGCSCVTISHRLEDMGIARHGRKIELDTHQFLKFREEGLSIYDIAEKMDCSFGRVQNELKKLNLPRKTTVNCTKYDKDYDYKKHLIITIKKLYSLGCPADEIAELIELSRTFVYQHLEETPRQFKGISIDEQLLIRLYTEEFKTTAEIAEIFGCSTSTIIGRLKKNNIKLRGNRNGAG